MASLITHKLKNGSRSYRVRYYYNRRYRKTPALKISENEINAIKKDIEHRLARDKAGLESFVDPFNGNSNPISIIEFTNWFIENKKTAKRKGGAVKKRTYDTYREAFKYLVNSTGNIPLSEIPAQIKDFDESMNHLSPVTKSKIIRSLRAAWNFGIEKEIITSNPFKGIEIIKSGHEPDPDVLTEDEKNRILVHLKGDYNVLGYVLLRWAALRRDEAVRNVRWENLDFKEEEIRIPNAKTKKNQRVPMLPKIKEVFSIYIKEYKKRHGEKPKGFIVDIHPDSLTHALYKAKIKAGINKRGSTHIFRHSAGTDLLDQGADIREVQEFLRHTSILTTQKYTHLSTKKLQKKFKDKVL